MAIPDPPNNSTLVDGLKYAMGVWLKWFGLIQRQMNITPTVIGSVSLSAKNATIAATSISTAPLASGMYRLSVYARVTTAAGVSSSLTPFITYVESGLTKTQTGGALTSNSTTAPGSWTFFARADAQTVLKYGFTYASNAAAAMVYGADVVVEFVPPKA